MLVLYVAIAAVIWIVTVAVRIGAFGTSDPVAVPAVALTTIVYGVPWFIALAVCAKVARAASGITLRLGVYFGGLVLILTAAGLFLSNAPNAGNPIDWDRLLDTFMLPIVLSALVVVPSLWSKSE